MRLSKCSPEEVAEGTRIGQRVVTFDGRTLLDVGTRFKNEHRRLLSMWGIKELVVESDCLTNESDLIAKDHQSETDSSEIQERFALNLPLSPVFSELHRIACEERISPRWDGFRRRPEGLFVPSEMERILSTLEGLPSLPRLLHELGSALADPLCSPQRIASIIEKDPSLTLRILKLVNSAFYNFPSPIDNLERAVTILGLRHISSLAQSALLIDTFKQIPQDVIDMRAFVRHSIAVGVTARTIASQAKLANSELIYLAGLLHDTGRLFLFVHFPDLMLAMMSDAWEEKKALFELERMWLGQDHGEIGARLIASWNLPLALEKAARYHHHPEMKDGDPICDVVHVADVLVHVMECGLSGERLVPRMNQDVWEGLGIEVDRVSDLMMESRSLCDLFCDIIEETGCRSG